MQDTVLAGTAPAAATRAGRGRIRSLCLAVFDVVLAAALAAAIFIAYGVVGNRWYHVVAVHGGSMEPTIMVGDLIIVTPPPAKVEPGMILVMGVDGKTVTHRVVEVRPDGSLVTKGDANQTNDEWGGKPITVFGQYQFRIPAVGRFLPISNASGAWFTSDSDAVQTMAIGSWESHAPPAECADMDFTKVIIGTSGDDRIRAGNGRVLVFGLAGNDTIEGGNGADCLVGGDGKDVLIGGNGKDVLLGGDGNDRLSGGRGNDVLIGGDGKDSLDGGPGTDLCQGTAHDRYHDCEGNRCDVVVRPLTDPTVRATPAPDPTPHPTPTSESAPPGASPTLEPTPGNEGSPPPSTGASPPPEPTPAATASPEPTSPPEATPEPTPAPTSTPEATTPDPTPPPDPTPSPAP